MVQVFLRLSRCSCSNDTCLVVEGFLRVGCCVLEFLCLVGVGQLSLTSCHVLRYVQHLERLHQRVVLSLPSYQVWQCLSGRMPCALCLRLIAPVCSPSPRLLNEQLWFRTVCAFFFPCTTRSSSTPEHPPLFSSPDLASIPPRLLTLSHRRMKISACLSLFQHAYRLRDAGAVIHSHGIYCVLAAMLCERRGTTTFRITHQEMIKGMEG